MERIYSAIVALQPKNPIQSIKSGDTTADYARALSSAGFYALTLDAGYAHPGDTRRTPHSPTPASRPSPPSAPPASAA